MERLLLLREGGPGALRLGGRLVGRGVLLLGVNVVLEAEVGVLLHEVDLRHVVWSEQVLGLPAIISRDAVGLQQAEDGLLSDRHFFLLQVRRHLGTHILTALLYSSGLLDLIGLHLLESM